MKKITLLLSVLMIQLPLYAQQRGSCGAGVTWELNGDTLLISGNGEMTNFDKPSDDDAERPSWYPYRAQIRHVVTKGAVSNIGNYAFYCYSDLESVELGEGVVRVGNRTFYNCTSLSELSLPNTLEKIGDKWTNYSDYGSSFYGCSSLKELTLPENVSFIGAGGFTSCNLEKVNWNAADCTVDITGYSNSGVFGSCPIREVHFGEKVVSVPRGCFTGRSSLETVTTHGTIEYVGENAFQSTKWLGFQETGKMVYVDHAAYLYRDETASIDPITITLPEGTTSITAGALSNNKKLVKVVLPSTLKQIGSTAFSGCSSLGEVEYNCIEVEDLSKAVFPSSVYSFTFGNEVKNLPSYLLNDCYGLSEINLPESLQTIGERVFEGCNGVKELTIPNNVTKIGRSSLYSMENLEKLTIGENLKDLEYYYVFGQCPKLTTLYWNAVALKEKEFDAYHTTDRCQAPVETVVFGDKVEYVPGQLFWGRSTLKNVTLGKSVRKIGEAAFRDCSGLTQIDFPASLDTICDYAFYHTGIEKLFIPENVASLGTWGLGIRTLKQVISTPTTAPKNSGSFIDHSDDLVLYVPNEKEYSSVSQGWGSYKKLIRPMVKADAEEFYYDGTTPKVSFTCNIPDYELVSISEAELDGSVGEHSATVEATFKGERDFTIQLTYNYVVNKGLQEIEWGQSLEGLGVGDVVVLEASVPSGLEVKFKSSSKNIELKQEDGKTVMTCKKVGNVKLTAYQSGGVNWEAASDVSKEFTIAEKSSTGIADLESDASSSVIEGTYDLSGRRTDALRRGVNIIRYSDGSVRKVLVK